PHLVRGDPVRVRDPATGAIAEIRDPARERWQRAATMRQQNVEPRVPAKYAGIEHVDDGPRRIEGSLDQRAGAAEGEIAIAARRWMDKERRAELVELGPDRLETRIAEIDAVEIAECRKAISSELLARAADFADRARRIGQRKHRYQPEMLRMGFDERRAISVGSDDHVALGDRAAIRDELRGDAGALHIGKAGVDGEHPGTARFRSRTATRQRRPRS